MGSLPKNAQRQHQPMPRISWWLSRRLPHPLPDVAGPAGCQEIVTEAKQRELLLLRFQHHVKARISSPFKKGDKLVPIDPIVMLTRLGRHTRDGTNPSIRVLPRYLPVLPPLRRKMDLRHVLRRPRCQTEAEGVVDRDPRRIVHPMMQGVEDERNPSSLVDPQHFLHGP